MNRILVIFIVCCTVISVTSTTSQLCITTPPSPSAVVDSTGTFCHPLLLDPLTQCCRAHATTIPSLSSCTKYCDPQQHCCKMYEGCVSCCLSSQYRQLAEKGLQTKRMLSPLYTDMNVGDGSQQKGLFMYCQVRCRTSSASVFHQNKYKSALHYCFGEEG
eukprot:PhF_6_TR28981/c0_g1_i1/m.42246